MAILTGTLRSDRIRGTSGIDVILALSGDDIIYGKDGADTIDGGDGDDTISANSARTWTDGDLDVILAGAGDDQVYAGLGDLANGGTGFDVLSLDLSNSTDGITVDFRPMTLLDLSGLVTIELKGATLAGFEAIGTVVGSDGDDVIAIGNQGRYGSSVNAGAGNDKVRGGNGSDEIRGGDGNDTLFAGGGKDLLIGGEGDDVLRASRGRDTLTGGNGADTFDVGDERDVGAGRKSADMISDFSHAEGDKVALNRIDAITGTDANDRFDFIGSDAFSGTAGELRSVIFDGNTVVLGDTDGDARADFAVRLSGEINLAAPDFVL